MSRSVLGQGLTSGMVVELVPGLGPLIRVLGVARVRAMPVTGVLYIARADGAALHLSMDPGGGRRAQTARQLERCVDVLSVGLVP